MRQYILDFLRKLIWRINRAFWHIFSISSASTFSSMPPPSFQKSAQKSSISASKAGYARSLFFLVVCFGIRLTAIEPYPHKFEGSFRGWENKPLELISLLLPVNPVILEAGAHYGNETIAMARLWPEAKIFALEPNPHAFEILVQATVPFDSIDCRQIALNDTTGKASFYICYGSTGDNPVFEHASSLLEPSLEMEVHYKGPILQVNCKNLDEWREENQIEPIDFLRLDIQGSELQVLEASPKTLSSLTAIYVHTNLFPFRIGTTLFPELKAFLEDHGFKLLAHWYREGLEGNAIFIKNTFFDGFPSYGDLENESFFKDPSYRLCYSPYLHAYFYIDTEGDSIKSLLSKGETWEGNIAQLIEKFAAPGTLAVDIGAHIGIHTFKMSKSVGDAGGVIAFEPQVKIYAEQLRNLRLNRCKNVLSLRKALGDRNQFIQMDPVDPTNEGGTGIGSGGDIAEMIPLDALNLFNVSFIKIDAERTEYYVLQGAKETILRNNPVLIFEILHSLDFESSTIEEKENYHRVHSLLKSYGYETYLIYGNDYIAFPKIEKFNETKKGFLPAKKYLETSPSTQ